jgi:riboflavin transporter FmnP
MSVTTKKLSVIAMLTALAYLVMLVIHIPVSFLTLDPKSTVIVIAGFMMGPLTALIISVIVAFLEMVTVSTTGPIGFLMNALATASFACTAALIYYKRRTLKNAILGLAAGTIVMTALMLLWNWLILPFYMEGVTRADVVPMIMPLLLPFNLLKGALNMAVRCFFTSRSRLALHKAKLLPESGGEASKRKFNYGVAIFAAIHSAPALMLLLAHEGAHLTEAFSLTRLLSNGTENGGAPAKGGFRRHARSRRFFRRRSFRPHTRCVRNYGRLGMPSFRPIAGPSAGPYVDFPPLP